MDGLCRAMLQRLGISRRAPTAECAPVPTPRDVTPTDCGRGSRGECQLAPGALSGAAESPPGPQLPETVRRLLQRAGYDGVHLHNPDQASLAAGKV